MKLEKNKEVKKSSAEPAFHRSVTLMELVVVMSILAVSSALIIPVALSQNSSQLDKAAWRIVADLQYVQSQAICKRKTQSIVFDVSQQFYFYPTDDSSIAEKDPITKNDYRILLGSACQQYSALSHTEEFPLVTLTSVDFSGADTLYFDSLGLPTASDGSALSTASIEITAGKISRTITINTTTGGITFS